MKKKKTALMMAAVMTVSLLAACGQKTSAPAAESTAQPDAAQTTEACRVLARGPKEGRLLPLQITA